MKWNGMFSPTFMKSGCEHGGVLIELGEPEFGQVEVFVQFNHTCSGRPAPSNSNIYTFNYELDDFVDEEGQAAADLQSELDEMSDGDRLKWINDNLMEHDANEVLSGFKFNI